MKERAPENVIADLTRKIQADIVATLKRTVLLVEHPEDQILLILNSVAVISGVCGAHMVRNGHSVDAAADAVSATVKNGITEAGALSQAQNPGAQEHV